jgi:hypothetical protein
MIEEVASAPHVVPHGLRVVVNRGTEGLADTLSSVAVSVGPMPVRETSAASDVSSEGADWVAYTSDLIDAVRAALPESGA